MRIKLAERWSGTKIADVTHEAKSFPWRSVLLRMAADMVLVTSSLVLAFSLRFLFADLFASTNHLEELAAKYREVIVVQSPLFSLLALLIFHLNGFYTRTRGYASRFKALVIFRAVTLFVIAFVFCEYVFAPWETLPRGVAALTWALSLATVGGSRLGKTFFLKNYRIQSTSPPSKIKRVLVLGGAGYLGSTIVPALLSKGYSVRVLDSLLFGDASLASVTKHPQFELLTGDVRDIQIVVEAMKDCDAVIHLAAIVGDPACEASRSLAIEVNRAATCMLIEVARGYGIRRFLFASTCSVYGASDFLVDEYTTVAPLSTYAETKVDSERLLLNATGSGFHPTVLRLGTLFGLSPRPRFDLVVNLLTARAVTTGKITIFNGQQWRPFLHVRDAARAFITCVEARSEIVSGQVFNVGDYELNMTLADVSRRIASIVPNLEVQFIENTDLRNYRVSFDKIYRRLQFACNASMEDGIREIYVALQKATIQDFTAAKFSNLAVTQAFAQSAGAERSSMRLLTTLAQSTQKQLATPEAVAAAGR
jgi:nucleoside-diphosphate-sugar epimerase